MRGVKGTKAPFYQPYLKYSSYIRAKSNGKLNERITKIEVVDIQSKLDPRLVI